MLGVLSPSLHKANNQNELEVHNFSTLLVNQIPELFHSLTADNKPQYSLVLYINVSNKP